MFKSIRAASWLVACTLVVSLVRPVSAQNSRPLSRNHREEIIFQQSGSSRLLILRGLDPHPSRLEGWNAQAGGRFDVAPGGECLAIEERTNGHAIQIVPISDHSAGPRLGEFKELRDPRWTADGRAIVATSNLRGRLGISIINLDTGAIRAINSACMSPVESRVGDPIFCQDTASVLAIGKDGNASDSIRLAEAIPGFVGKMPSALDVSSDDRRVIVEVDVRDRALAWHDGTKSEVYVWDRPEKRLTRVSRADMFAREPRWIGPKGDWLFLGFELTEGNKEMVNAGGWPAENLYRASGINATEVQEIATHVSRYSVAREREVTRGFGSPMSGCASK